jgi:hypothetical protein
MSAAGPSLSPPIVEFSPSRLVTRRIASWPGLRAETVQVTNKEPFEYGFRADCHLLIASERAHRDDGETFVETLPKSKLREFSRKLTFVPAGHEFHGCQRPRVLTNVTYFYIDPRGPLSDPELLSKVELAPRLFFFDSALWETAVKLKAQIGNTDDGRGRAETYSRGGLASWQQKRVADFLDEHLTERVTARGACRDRAIESFSLRTCIQAIVRHASTPVSPGAPYRSGKISAQRLRAIRDENSLHARIRRIERFHGDVSQADGIEPLRYRRSLLEPALVGGGGFAEERRNMRRLAVNGVMARRPKFSQAPCIT